MKHLTRKEAIVVTSAFLILILSYVGCVNIKDRMDNYRAIAKLNTELQNKVKTYQDENGRLHTQIEKSTVDASAYKEIYKKQVDSLADLLGIKSKNITDLSVINTELRGRIKTRIDTVLKYDTVQLAGSTRIDTVRILEFPYKDNWMTFKGQLNEKKGTFTADYSIKDSLTVVEYTRGTGFLKLGAKKSYIDISSSNPNFTITAAKNIELKKLRTKQWSLGPYVGYGFNGSQWQPSIGVSVQRTILRF